MSTELEGFAEPNGPLTAALSGATATSLQDGSGTPGTSGLSDDARERSNGGVRGRESRPDGKPGVRAWIVTDPEGRAVITGTGRRLTAYSDPQAARNAGEEHVTEVRSGQWDVLDQLVAHLKGFAATYRAGAKGDDPVDAVWRQAAEDIDWALKESGAVRGD